MAEGCEDAFNRTARDLERPKIMIELYSRGYDGASVGCTGGIIVSELYIENGVDWDTSSGYTRM